MRTAICSVAGLLVLGVGSPASAALAATPTATQVPTAIPTAGCTDFSDDYDVLPGERCIGGLQSKSRQAYVAPGCIVSTRSTKQGAEYFRAEANACEGIPNPYDVSYSPVRGEALTTARIIAQANDRSVYGDGGTAHAITPNVQWEVDIPNSGGFQYGPSQSRQFSPDVLRADLVLYQRKDAEGKPIANPILKVIEVKQTAYLGEKSALVWAGTQAKASVDQLQHDGYRAELYDPSEGAIVVADWYDIIVRSCVNPATSERVWWRQTAKLAARGVILVDREVLRGPCTEAQRVHDLQIGKEEGEAIPEVVDQPGDDESDGYGDLSDPNFFDCLLNAGKIGVEAVDFVSRLVERGSWRAVRPTVYSGSPGAVASLEVEAAGSAAAERAAAQVGVRAAFAGSATSAVMLGVLLGVVGSCAINPNAFGDPHLASLDGLSYDLQSVGEFHLAKAGDLDVQARFVPYSEISILDTVAVRTGNDTVQFRHDGQVLINGRSDIATGDGVFYLPDGSTLLVSGGKRLLATQNPSALVLFEGRQVSVRVAAGVHPVGLLGNNDGDPLNDLRTAGGTQLSAPVSPATLYGQYAESWRVTDATSAFTYGAGESTATFSAPRSPDIRTLSAFSADDIDAATEMCRARQVSEGPVMDDCVYDVLVTGDGRFIDAAAAVTDELVDPTRASFAGGHLEEDFEAPVPTEFAASKYVAIAPNQRAAGPYFSLESYRVGLAGVPRHDVIGITADLVAMGPTQDDGLTQSVDLVINDGTHHHALLEGPPEDQAALDPSVSVELIHTGMTPSGIDYRTYRVTLSEVDASSAATIQLIPAGFHGALDTGLGIDRLAIDLSTPAPDTFEVELPLSVSDGVPMAGAGRLETAGALDRYEFSITSDEARRGITINGSCAVLNGTVLVDAMGVSLPYTGDAYCATRHFATPHAGDYAIEVSGIGKRSYALEVFVTGLSE